MASTQIRLSRHSAFFGFRGVCAAAAFVAFSASAQTNAPQPPADVQGVVTFQASAHTEVVKDVLSITLATMREGPDAATVQAGLKQALDAALQEGRKVAKPGLLEVETGNFSLSPRHGKDGRINGWQGIAELRVQGRDMAAVGQLAGRIRTLSVSNVDSSVSRELREQTEAELTAQAIARFRAKAGELARQFGYAGHVVRQVNVGVNGAAFMAQESRVSQPMSVLASDVSLPVEAGKATVTVNVSGSVQMVK